MSKSVRDQYERFPYPAVPAMALPLRSQGLALKYETGVDHVKNNLGFEIDATHKGKRILVAGCGTIEALVVAQMHPQAKEIVAVDLSESSLNILKLRLTLARFRNALTFFLPGRKLPPIRLAQADLHTWQDEPFDYIVASNILHHVPEPAQLLKHLVSLLKDDGLMRLVTYPCQSRLWIRATASYLQGQNIHQSTHSLLATTQAAIQKLPAEHVVRLSFENYPENNSATGIVDAYLHVCETALSPLAWKVHSEKAGLTWVTEAQNLTSQGQFLDEIIPAVKNLEPWIKLQLMDDLLELCANPVIWFLKRPCRTNAAETLNDLENLKQNKEVFSLEEQIHFEMSVGLKRVAQILKRVNVPLNVALLALKENVGQHVAADGVTPLQGLSVTDYDWSSLD